MTEKLSKISDWKETTLGKISTKIGSGATPRGGSNSYKDEGISLIRSQNVLDLQFSTDGLAFIDEEQAEGLKNVTLEPKDVLLNITGDSVARTCIVPDHIVPARVNQHVAIIRANKELAVPEYILYNLISQKEELLMQSEIGATRKAITKGMLEQFELKLPSFTEQQSIAEVLSSLDDKIDLLQHQNQTLEQMAETLFRQWFVEEADDSWEVKRLDEMLTIVSSKRIFYKEYVDFGIPFYRSKEIIELANSGSTNSELYITNERFNEIESKYGAPNKGDILLTSVGTLGVSYKVRESDKFYFKDGNLTWFKDFEELSSNIVYCWLNSKIGKEALNEITIGSTQAALTLSDLRAIELSIPPKDVQNKLDNELDTIFKKLNHNLDQIKTLQGLRDSLLPKLMDGTIKVKNG